METKEYIVILNKDVDYNQIWNDIESPTSGLPHIPDRPVSIINNHDAFDRMCAYALTDAEVELLKQDHRVAGIEIPIEQMPGVEIKRCVVQNPSIYNPQGNFNKQAPNSSAGSSINWGLIRNSNSGNVYGTGSNIALNYNYVLDGTGVDVVISDSGIQADHPEFTDANGVSRVQQINWATYVPALSTMPSPYEDHDGHGTHVAGTVAGKTYGWAKNARIYSIIATGPNQPSSLNQFAAIKLWHQSKGSTGRPTVVNMSWGSRYQWWYLGGLPSTTPDTYTNWQLAMNNFISTITSVNYQGKNYAGNTNLTAKGLLLDPNSSDCVYSFRNGTPLYTQQTDVPLSDLIDAGVIVVHAAGNNSYKIDVSGTATNDYNNIVNTTKGSIAYNRGSSPKSTNSICVGSLDSVAFSTTLDQKATYSCTGPGVDIYAVGTNVMSSTTNDSTTDSYKKSAPYFLNSNFRQLNDTGTSMASPQIAGMAALYLQANPPSDNLSPSNCSRVKSWLTSVATPTMNSSGSATTYTDFRSVLGGNASVAYQSIQGLSKVKINDTTWKNVAAVKVKTSDTTWTDVKTVWTKTDTGWRQVY
jgi:subtilisin family serine protease